MLSCWTSICVQSTHSRIVLLILSPTISYHGDKAYLVEPFSSWIERTFFYIEQCLYPGKSIFTLGSRVVPKNRSIHRYTVPSQSIRQVPWHVTHLTKIWFQQPPNFAVTCTKISAVWRRRQRKISILGIWSPNDFVTSPKWLWQSWHFVDFGRPVMCDWRIDWNGTV